MFCRYYCGQLNIFEYTSFGLFQACEAMVSKCGSEISPHIPAIVELCLEYLTYDPNYNYDDGDDSDMECDDDGDEENGTDDEYSDDDDVSWKVRRAAAKCLEAVILSRHELNWKTA